MLHITRINLMSTNSMSNLARRLEQNSNQIPWTDVLTSVAVKTMEFVRRGEPVTEIHPDKSDTLEVEYLLKPFLYLNHPTVLFGDYGSLKSLMALVTVYLVQRPYFENNLGLVPFEEPTKCLYLDYEDDESSFRKRWSAIDRGFNQGEMPILHRRMTAPLADSVDGLQHILHEKGIGMIVVDSLGPAARGNLNDPEPAIRYHEALRQLGVTSFTLAHTSKDQLTKRRTIFGSVFFTNLARSVWECRAEQEAGEDEAVISLKHAKHNLSKEQLPLGYRFTFTDNSISITKTDLRETGLSVELPLTLQIKGLLRQGALSIHEIAEQLSANTESVGRTLRRMRDKNQVMKLEADTWGLCY